MPVEHCIQRCDGFEVHVLRSEALEVRIIPELGAKIASLRCLISGREWLWSLPGARLSRNRLGDSFGDGPLVGADECFPTVASCFWNGRTLPDHGEIWTEPWDVEVVGGSVLTVVRCPISPFTFRRRASLDGQELRLDYEVENTGQEEEAFLWAFHPLLAINDGDQIELPVSTVKTDFSMNCPLGEFGACWNWPRPGSEIQLARMDFGPFPMAAAKLYAENLGEGHAAIRSANTGESLEFRFDLHQLDSVGLWINRGGWNGFHHVAIEPTNSTADSLAVASRLGRCGRLPAGQSQRWTVVLKASFHDL